MYQLSYQPSLCGSMVNPVDDGYRCIYMEWNTWNSFIRTADWNYHCRCCFCFSLFELDDITILLHWKSHVCQMRFYSHESEILERSCPLSEQESVVWVVRLGPMIKGFFFSLFLHSGERDRVQEQELGPDLCQPIVYHRKFLVLLAESVLTCGKVRCYATVSGEMGIPACMASR